MALDILVAGFQALFERASVVKQGDFGACFIKFWEAWEAH